MAIRAMRQLGDPVLRLVCPEVADPGAPVPPRQLFERMGLAGCVGV